ncbi:hypothetical protein [Nocardia sp. IFM 10818]
MQPTPVRTGIAAAVLATTVCLAPLLASGTATAAPAGPIGELRAERPPRDPETTDGGSGNPPPKWTRKPRPGGNGWTVCPPRAAWCRR